MTNANLGFRFAALRSTPGYILAPAPQAKNGETFMAIFSPLSAKTRTRTSKYASLFIAIGIIVAAIPLKADAQLPSIQWMELSTLNNTVNAMYASGSFLYAGTEGGGVSRSNNGGVTWEAVNSGLPAGVKVRAFEYIGMSLFAGTDKGVFRSNDQGQTWTEVNNGLTYTAGSSTPPRPILTLSTIGMALFAGGAKVDGVSGITVSIYRSDNLGQTWAEVKNGLPATTSCSGFAFGAAGLFAATDAGVYRSADNGQNWTSANFQSATSLAAIGQDVFALKREGIWRSADQGLNWTQIFKAAEGQAGGFAVKLIGSGANLFALDEFIYSSTSTFPRISFSPDSGKNWYDTEVPNFEVNPLVVTAVYVSGDKLYAWRGDRKLFVRPGFFSPGIAAFSSASYFDRAFASESLATAFGSNLAPETRSATTLPLPTNLGGVSVKVKDSKLVERDALLLYVSPSQINFLISAGVANGSAVISITRNNTAVGTGQILMQSVAPGLFTANANGYGVPAAVVQRIKADGSVLYEPVAEFDSTAKEFVPRPIDLGAETDKVSLVLFGTGIKGRSALNRVKLLSDGPDLQITYAGPQGDYVGLDQVNVTLTRNLIGRGQLFFYLDVDSVPSNVVVISVR